MSIFISANSGRGKTRHLIRLSDKITRIGGRIVYIVPTIDLADQMYIDLCSMGIHHVYKIHGKCVTGSVAKALNTHLQTNTRKCQIVITTHEAFSRLSYFNRPERWIIIIDEVMKVYQSFSINIPKVHKFLTDHLCLVGSSEYAPLMVTNTAEITKIRDNKLNDLTYEAVKQLAAVALHKGWDVYVHSQKYNDFINGSSNNVKLEAYALLNMSPFKGFKEVIVASAFFEESFFYHIMKYNGLKFTPMAKLPVELQTGPHDNGHLLDLHYLDVNRNSKAIMADRPEVKDGYVDYVKTLFGSDDFLWSGNKPKSGEPDVDPFDGLNGVKLSGSPHGLNDYREYDKVAILSAYNPSPQETKFLKWIGMSSNAVDKAMHISNVYQAIMRCSLRESSSITRKIVVVPDKRTAAWLMNVFPGATLFSIPVSSSVPVGKVGRPSIYGSNTLRSQAYRNRKKAEKEALELNKTGQETDAMDISGAKPELNWDKTTRISTSNGNEKPIDYRDSVASSGFQTGFHIKLYNSIYDSGAKLTEIFASADDYVSYLSIQHSNVFQLKEDNRLFDTSTLHKNHIKTEQRKLKSIEFIHSLILDIDGGDIGVDEFIDAFPNFRFCIYNTFNSTASKIRWRAVFPTRYMTVDEHKACWNAMLAAVVKLGYPLSKADPENPSLKAHGIDSSKRVASSLFYLPCQAELGATQSFFHDLKGETRCLLNPDEWIQLHKPAAPIFIAAPPFPANHGSSKPWSAGALTTPGGGVEAAINRWRTNGRIPKQGNDEFFLLGANLARAGMGAAEIENVLKEQAFNGRTPDERQKQIPGILGYLQKHPQV